MPRFPLKQIPLYITLRIALFCSMYIIPNTTFQELQVFVVVLY
jgi:hypothetical protein